MAVMRQLRLRECRLRLRQSGLRLLQLGYKLIGVDLGQNLTLLHMVVEIDIQLVDAPRHLRTDIDLSARRERAGCADIHREKAARDGLRDIAVRRSATQGEPRTAAENEHGCAHPQPEPPPLSFAV